MKLLIGYDGSESARAAVADLAFAGLPAETLAKVVTVADVLLPPDTSQAESALPPPVAKARQLAQQALAEAQATAGEGAALVKANFPWAVESEGLADSPAWGLIQAAEQWHADLLVVGSHGKSAAGRLFLGSVSLKVATEARCSVRIGRTRPRPSLHELNILLAYDGSPHADAALSAVAQRQWPAGTRVVVVAVIEPRVITDLASEHSSILRWMEPQDKDARAPFERMIENACQRLAAAGVQVSSRVVEGDPKHQLLQEQERLGADCVFVGARGLNFFQRFLLGSVSATLATRAQCTVEIIRPTS